MRKLVIAATSLALILCLTSCASEASELDDEIGSLGEITLESYAVLEDLNRRYEALEDEDKMKVENYVTLEDANKRMSDILYAELIGNLDKIASLEANYFAQHYDMSGVNSAKDAAQKAINNSDEGSYYSVYESLEAELALFSEYVEAEMAASYSLPTGQSVEYPFMLTEEDLPAEWSFRPLATQTSSHPTLIISEQEATDLPKWVVPFIGGNGREYTYLITQVPTTKITVEDENGEMWTAYVNTQLQLEQYRKEATNRDPNKELNERPAYFLVRQSDYGILLALQDYDGGDHYVLYG